MPIVYFLPGFGGTELVRKTSGRLLWLGYDLLSSGHILEASLAADGVSPGPPAHTALISRNPLPDYFGGMIRTFAAQLLPQGDQLLPVGYDWRMSSDLAGLALANGIVDQVSAAEPATIVAYSLGCYAARRAYWYLKQRGMAGLIRRIVLVGSPSYGCYQGVALIGRANGSAQQLAYLSNLDPFSDFLRLITLDPPFITKTVIAEIACTWPGLYESFPAINAPDAAADTRRADVYRPGAYDPVVASREWLNSVVANWQPWLLSADSVPPPAVLTLVYGIGTATAYRRSATTFIDSPDAFEYTLEGDGVCTKEQSILPGAALVELQARHADMYDHIVDSGLLLELVNDRRSPAESPPEPEVFTDAVAPSRDLPPFPPSVYTGNLAAVRNWSPGNDP